MEERDLGALIENGLKDLAGRIDESRTEARQRFEQLEKDLAGRIDESRVETRQRFEQLEGEIRQTRTQLQGEIRQLDGFVRLGLSSKAKSVSSTSRFKSSTTRFTFNSNMCAATSGW